MNVVSPIAVLPMHACLHCGADTPGERRFCCQGCAGAYAIVESLGLQSYYSRRQFDPRQRPTKPESKAHGADIDLSAWITEVAQDRAKITMLIDGLHCGACMWLIEQTLLRQVGVIAARVSLTARRLTVEWRPSLATAETLVDLVQSLGYRLTPAALASGNTDTDHEGAFLLRCLAVAGFAAGNIMLFSVSVWSGHASGIAAGTRDLFHWVSALIAVPAIAFAGRPFFASALAAIKSGRTNMDVPISIAVLLAPTVSLYETFVSGPHAYFDSAVTLLFFLLVGRYLDHRTRRAARFGAEYLAALNQSFACIIAADGSRQTLPPRDLRAGMIALVAPGDRIPADGTVIEGQSDIDVSLINGESMPRLASPHTPVFAGTLNLTGALRIMIDKSGDDTLLAEIVRLMEVAETRRGRYVRLADRVARYYAPVVHLTALSSFVGWVAIGAMPWPQAMMIAISVLIITCPCALALAVPVTQVVACGRLMRAGILLKTGDALERLARVNHVVLDKTGTLTFGRMRAKFSGDDNALAIAAGMAARSRHPAAQAVAALLPGATPLDPVEEIPGGGLKWRGQDGEWRLGSARFVGAPAETEMSAKSRCYLSAPATKVSVIEFDDELRPGAREACAELQRLGGVEICSGDSEAAVRPIAEAVGIAQWRARMSPLDKATHLELLGRQSRQVLMVGDGLNDAPSLAAASVSMAPSTGADLTQTKADVVFQGDELHAVPLTIRVARLAGRIMRQNLAIALVYNLAAVPLAIMGFVTPLVAALAMSSSSILVVANSLRLNRVRAMANKTP